MVPYAGLVLARSRLAHVRKRAATARALCGVEAQHACLPRSRVSPRGLDLAVWATSAADAGLEVPASSGNCGRGPMGIEAPEAPACRQSEFRQLGHYQRWPGAAARPPQSEACSIIHSYVGIALVYASGPPVLPNPNSKQMTHFIECVMERSCTLVLRISAHRRLDGQNFCS